MSRVFTLILAVIVIFVGYVNATHKTPVIDTSTVIEQPVTKPDGTGVLIKTRPVHKDIRAFMHSIGKMESKNNPKAVNSLGMLGRYQFDPRTIRAMGFKVTREEFLNDEDLQDRVMLAFMRDNKRTLRHIIKRYDGKVVNGVKVTESGVLAASHLAGVGGVLTFFYPEKYQFKTSDSNGASVAMYMKKFSNYDMRGL